MLCLGGAGPGGQFWLAIVSGTRRKADWIYAMKDISDASCQVSESVRS